MYIIVDENGQAWDGRTFTSVNPLPLSTTAGIEDAVAVIGETKSNSQLVIKKFYNGAKGDFALLETVYAL